MKTKAPSNALPVASQPRQQDFGYERRISVARPGSRDAFERAASTAVEALGRIVSVGMDGRGMTISIQAEALFRTGAHP